MQTTSPRIPGSVNDDTTLALLIRGEGGHSLSCQTNDIEGTQSVDEQSFLKLIKRMGALLSQHLDCRSDSSAVNDSVQRTELGQSGIDSFANLLKTIASWNGAWGRVTSKVDLHHPQR